MSSGTSRQVHIPRTAEVVAGDLRRRIVTGEIGLGDTLPREAELVAQYGVSRPTLREAIRILESQSLISIQRGSRTGALVQPPDIRVAALHAAIRLQLERTPLSDVFEARVEIGVSAVRMVAARRPSEMLSSLRSLHLDAGRVTRDSTDFPVAVTRFHAAIVDAAGNRSLALVRRILEEIVLSHERSLPDIQKRRVKAVADHDLDDHAAVMEAIAQGDPDRAEAIWRPHLVNSAATVLDLLGPDTVVDLLGGDALGRPRGDEVG